MHIREKNVERLNGLDASAQMYTQPDERDDEFRNIRQPQNLKDLDSRVFNLLTPEPPRSKALGLLNSAGKHIISSNHIGLKPRDHALYKIEENYQDSMFDDGAFNDPFSGTLVIRWSWILKLELGILIK